LRGKAQTLSGKGLNKGFGGAQGFEPLLRPRFV